MTGESGGKRLPLGRVLVLVVAISAVLGAAGGYAISSLANPRPAAQTREFYVVTTTLAFNESYLGLPHDIFSSDHLLVGRGDTVLIHFYNTEEGEIEDHTFTMEAPYAVNHLVANGQHVNITFTANSAGTFAYRCTLHQPTMTGYLTVVG